jgi:type IV secretion system protein VirD4
LPSRPQLDAAALQDSTGDDDTTGSERRQQPELTAVKPVERKAPIANEFDLDGPDDADDDAARAGRLNQVMQGVARQVSLDPNDGMDL